MDDTLQTLWAVVEATARRPFGQLSLITFVGGALAHVALRDIRPRAGTLMYLVMCIGGLGFGLAATDTYQVMPSMRTFTEHLPVREPSVPARSSSGGDSRGGRTYTSRLPGQSGVTPSSGSGGGSLTSGSSSSGGSGNGSAVSSVWTSDGEVSDEVMTGDHACPNEERGILTCEGDPTRTTYHLTLSAGLSRRLVSVDLRCLEGPCLSSHVNYARVSDDQTSAEASFDVWSGPTRWQLTAKREKETLSFGR